MVAEPRRTGSALGDRSSPATHRDRLTPICKDRALPPHARNHPPILGPKGGALVVSAIQSIEGRHDAAEASNHVLGVTHRDAQRHVIAGQVGCHRPKRR